MRHTKGKTRRRRSHHGVDTPRLSTCDECGEKHLRHTVCPQCGTYRGKKFIDVEAQKLKKLERRKKKAKELGLEPDEVEEK